MDEVVGTTDKISVTYEGLVHDVEQGSTILLDDGLIGLEVLDVDAAKREIKTKVLNNGTLKNKKGVNVPGVSVNLPGITEKDARDIVFGIEQGVDFIAPSFIRRSTDVLEIRELLEEHNAQDIQIIPKIENQEGVDNIDAILEVSDGLMVARGDLGVEIPAEEVPLVQKELIKNATRWANLLLQRHKCLTACSATRVRLVRKQVTLQTRSSTEQMRSCFQVKLLPEVTRLKQFKQCITSRPVLKKL